MAMLNAIEQPHNRILLEESSYNDILSLQEDDFIVGSVHDPNVLQHVADQMEHEGIAIGGFNETVCYILGNAADNRFIDSVINLKGTERANMPLALSHSAKEFISLVDLTAIPEHLQVYFQEESESLLNETFGQLAFLRVPVKKDMMGTLPDNVISGRDTPTPMIQNWLPTNALAPLVEKMEQKKMTVGITSLNKHGLGSIVNQYEGAVLAKQYIGGYLFDQHYPNDISRVFHNGKPKIPYGSYPIIEMGMHLEQENGHGVSLVRPGPYDPRAIMALFPGKRINYNTANKQSTTIDFPEEIIEALDQAEDSKQVRTLIIMFLKGLFTD